MSATFTNHVPDFDALLSRAVDEGLKAGGRVLQPAVRKRYKERGFKGGYTTGADATGLTIDSIALSDPVTEDGVRVLRVGLPSGIRQPGDSATVGEVALFWELGHTMRNGVRRRVETWRPVAEESRHQVAAAFEKRFAAVMNGTARKPGPRPGA